MAESFGINKVTLLRLITGIRIKAKTLGVLLSSKGWLDAKYERLKPQSFVAVLL